MTGPRIITQETTLEPIDAVTPHPKNPRRGATAAILESIRATGFYGALLAQRSTGFILAGSHRWAAAKQAGMTELPVTWLDVDDEQATRILLADNRTSDLATYDAQALADLLGTLAAPTTGTGYTPDDLSDLLAHVNPYTPPIPPTPARRERTPAEPDPTAATITPGAAKDLHRAMCPNCGHEFLTD